MNIKNRRPWLPAAIALAAGLIAGQAIAQTDTLLSRNVATSASSQLQAANLAVDGDLGSRWESTHGIDPSWLALDLGSNYNLTRAVVRWEAANAASYTVQGSNNNSTWTTIATRTGGTFGERTDTLTLSGNYRYVRVNGTARSAGNSWGYSIWELEVYGTAGNADQDGDGVPNSLDQCPNTPAGANVDSNGCEIALPLPWRNGDIGSPRAGLASLTGGVFTTAASGTDIWGNSDSFHYVYQPVNGNVTITAQVTSLDATNPWAKAGVMIRDGLGADAKNAFIAVTPANGVNFQRRIAAAGASTNTQQTGAAAPYWVRLVRSGNSLTGYYSTNGSSWTQLGTETISLTNQVYVGLAHTSHDAALTGLAKFANVSVQTSAWANRDIGTPLAGSATVSGSTVTTRAAGDDIWNASDNFHYVYQPLAGDGALVAQVSALEATDAWAKAGVMIRDGLAANARNALVAITAANGATFQRRTAAGAASVSTVQAGFVAPYWVKISRNGTRLNGYVSANGVNWTAVGNDTISLGAEVYIGLAHTSHNTAQLGTATFNQVALQPGAVCFYEQPNYGGASSCSGVAAQNFGAGWTGQVSSVKVVEGYSLRLYSQANQGGSTVTLTSDVANLSQFGFDNLANSFAITNGQTNNSQYKVVGYMPDWAGSPEAIQYGKLTHINYSFALPNSNGTLQGISSGSANKLRSIVNLAHARGVKVGIAIGGWNDGNDSAFESLAINAGTRTAFVNNVINFVTTYNLDGVDMDWEYPDQGASADRYALLMQELSNALHARGKYLSAAVVASGGSGIKTEVFGYVDMLNIMAYDGGNGAGHSPYSYAQNALNYWLGRGLPREKAVLGVPYYARPSWLGYNQLVASNGANACRDTNGSDYWNGIPTIRQKAQLARNQAGGIMTWELSQDTNSSNSLLTAMYETINGLPQTYNCN